MTRAAALAAVVVALAGCSAQPESDADTASLPAISAERYYESMRYIYGDTLSEEGADAFGRGFCSDLDGMDAETRRLAPVALGRVSGLDDGRAMMAAFAMTGRWCPEHAELWPEALGR